MIAFAGLVIFASMFGWLLGAGAALSYYVLKYTFKGLAALIRMGFRALSPAQPAMVHEPDFETELAAPAVSMKRKGPPARRRTDLVNGKRVVN